MYGEQTHMCVLLDLVVAVIIYIVHSCINAGGCVNNDFDGLRQNNFLENFMHRLWDS